MGHEPINGHSYASLTKKYDNESTEFYHQQDKIAESYRLTHNDNLPDTTFWKYLEERRSIDPSRFDHYHKMVGKWIMEIPKPPECFPVGSMCIPPPPNNNGMPGPAAAEPSSSVLLALGIILMGTIMTIVRSTK
jgi:hypothetical protein